MRSITGVVARTKAQDDIHSIGIWLAGDEREYFYDESSSHYQQTKQVWRGGRPAPWVDKNGQEIWQFEKTECLTRVTASKR